MLVYKFRILLEEDDHFFREIEILPTHTFAQFHLIMQECCGFSNDEMASFYICDSKWNKLQELTLFDMSDTEAEDEDEEKPSTPPPMMMEKVQIRKCISDPHQRMMYVYDFLKMWTFYIELYKITDQVNGVSYPRCVKCTGNIPVSSKGQVVPLVNDDEEEELLKDTNDIFRDDDTFESEESSIFGEPAEDNNYN